MLAMEEETLAINSAVRGFHVYKNEWNPVLGETLLCEQEFGNIHDPYAVAVVRDKTIIGHVPRKISSLCFFFLKKNGSILCQVTGKRRRSADLLQGGLEVPCTLTFVGPSREIHKVRNLISLAPTKTVEPTPSKKIELQVVSEESSDSDEEAQWLTFRGCLLIDSDKEFIIIHEPHSPKRLYNAHAEIHLLSCVLV